jgi:hypothetical protein
MFGAIGLTIYVAMRLHKKQILPPIPRTIWRIVIHFYPLLNFFPLHLININIIKHFVNNNLRLFPVTTDSIPLLALACMSLILNCGLTAFILFNCRVLVHTKDQLSGKTTFSGLAELGARAFLPALWLL